MIEAYITLHLECEICEIEEEWSGWNYSQDSKAEDDGWFVLRKVHDIFALCPEHAFMSDALKEKHKDYSTHK